MRRGEALVKLGAIVRDRGEGERARSLFAEAVELLERAPPSPELVLAYTHLARYYHFTWPPEQCFEWAEKAMATARELSLEGQGMRALVFRGFTRFELGDPGGLDDLNEALRVGLELGMGGGHGGCVPRPRRHRLVDRRAGRGPGRVSERDRVRRA